MNKQYISYVHQGDAYVDYRIHIVKPGQDPIEVVCADRESDMENVYFELLA